MRAIGVLFVLSGVMLGGGRGDAAADSAEAAVRRVLDGFHAAASVADEQRYFGHLAPDAVFLGTDATERWSVPEFREYVHPYFSEGRGWTYVATERHVVLSEGGTVAWFDETLRNEKYGELRGTGVLRRIDGEWKIAQYSMTFLVPNDVAGDVVEAIRAKTGSDADADPSN
jgi:ketosteroid isomerase-like protein